MENLEKQLSKLKGKREILWRNHKSANETDKTTILKEINELNDKIDTIQAHKNAPFCIVNPCGIFDKSTGIIAPGTVEANAIVAPSVCAV